MEMLKKITETLKIVFGYGIMICLFSGALTFVGYLVALVVGGNTAVIICDFIYKKFMPIVIYTSNLLVVLGLVCMYLSNQHALTSSKKKAVKHEGEM